MRKTTLLTLLTATLAAAPCASAAGYLDRSAWSWKSSSICAAEGDITGLEGLYDGDVTTCWHSNWHAESGSAERSNPHWVMIDRGTDSSQFYGLAYTPRQESVNQACTSYYIYLRDTDLSSTPATSVTDIVNTLGSPDASGTWEATLDEKFAIFDKPSTARYILFVNVASYNSSSAACAEMNLTTDSEVNPGTNAYNAIKITPVKGRDHRIAICGNELTMSMSFGYIRMSNSDITIEYAPEEVERFSFERYEFDNDATYAGSKKDILSETFSLATNPAPGKVESLTDIRISAAGGLETRINPSASEAVKVCGNDGSVIRSIAPQELAIAGTDYVIGGVNATESGTYSLAVPAELFIEPDGARSEALNAEWTIADQEQDAIEAIKADCPTLTLRHVGGNLIVGGIISSKSVALVNTSGAIMVTAKVNAEGTAVLPVGSLAKGVYLLSINETTLKIII